MLETILNFISNQGVGTGLIVVIIIGICYYILTQQKKLIDKIIETKDEEIKRLVEDNKNLRNVFTSLIKEKLNIKEDEIVLGKKNLDELELKEIEKSKKS